MSQEVEDDIRRRAYALWDAEGRPQGRDLEFWLRAEQELLAQQLATVDALARDIAATLPKRVRRKARAA
ncbi:MAG: DUF2934 domain-containing protein [Alsobacter sp.]